MPGSDAMVGEDELVALLAAIYRRVAWSELGGKSVLDLWTSRLMVASRAPTLPAAVDRLCGLLGVRSMPEDAVPLLASCRVNEADLLDILADETIPIAMSAYVLAKEQREARKAAVA